MVVLVLELILFIGGFLSLVHKLRTHSRTPPSPPGPNGLPVIGNLHKFYNSASHIYLWRLAEKYGPLMSMKLGSVPLLVVSSPKIAEQVLKTHDLSFCSRPKVLGRNRLSYNGLDVAFAPYGESWREMRKICVVHLLSNKQVQSFRGVREEEVYGMIENVSATARSGQDINFTTAMFSVTSRLICRIAFGQTHGEGGSYFQRFDELMIECQAMQGGFFFSDYLPLFSWLDRVTGSLGRLDRVCKDLDEFFNDLINAHLIPSRVKTSNLDILDLLIQLKEEKSSPIDLTWDHIKAMLMDIFIAATDTSAATMVWAMTALIKNPKVMKKLQDDIRDSIGKKGKINEEDLSKIPYLKAVVKEVLRLYPPAPLLPRDTLEECVVQGYVIPPKTTVFINAWAIARDPEYWKNPNEFVPERFLDTSVDITGQDFHVIPFGSGRRGCPGIAMGLVNVELMLSNLVYLFDWALPDGIKQEDIDEEVFPGLTMHKKNPICLVPKNYGYV